MGRSITDRDWPRIRYDYEHTDKLNREICAEHGISSTTLQNRARQWNWAPRRAPVPAEGPPSPPMEAPQIEAPQTEAPHSGEPSQHLVVPPLPVNARQIAQSLQSAIARVLAAIDLALTGLSAASSPRDIDRAGRAVAALTRTLHELNALKAQSSAFDAEKDRGPDDDNEFVRELIDRKNRFAAMRSREAAGAPRTPNPPA